MRILTTCTECGRRIELPSSGVVSMLDGTFQCASHVIEKLRVLLAHQIHRNHDVSDGCTPCTEAKAYLSPVPK